jgi:non-ribosomal peptide synthase protein (TIGR01720 family)
VISGGERLEESLKNRLLDIGYTLYNNYGPTEVTVDALFDKCSEEKVSLGKPLSNVTCYILDKDNNPAPIGVIGELCIAGAGVTRGYLNNPKLTNKKFLRGVVCRAQSAGRKANNTIGATRKAPRATRLPPGRRRQKIYRTGDLARWRPDGKVEYIGRQDYQIKLRGYRIELAEIETLLKEHPGIENAVVTTPGEKENLLIAYYVMKKSGSISISSNTLQDYLKGKLPDYMIPGYFIQLEKIPLTSTGKIDRNALPEPEASTADQKYIPPGNEMEEKLMEIWQEVLGVEKIGTTDNFFQIGGDSIKAIQLSARLRKYRLDLKINDLFLHPSIKESAKCVKPSHQIIGQEYQQGTIAGEVPLTPIQQWFFENHFTHHHYYNHAVMLYNKEGFDKTIIRKLFTKITLHHDALRMVYRAAGDKILQWNRGTDAKKEGKLFDFEVFQLTNRDRSAIEREANRIQASIDLTRGPLVKLGLFKTAEGDHLLIVIHHLVVDGISWRILLEDFRIGYQQLEQGEEIKFQEKTVSFQYWAQQLKEYSESKEILKELEYWKKIEKAKSPPLPVDYKPAEKRKKYRDMESLRIDFNEEETVKLLTDVHRPYNTNINDILLTALGMAIKEWSGNETVVINLEGHGRESISDDRNINTSRTIGWFTCQFPVLLDMSNVSDLSASIKLIKETLRRIPNKGIGCGLLRYLTPGDKKKGIGFSITPEISFNYLGQFHETSNSGFFTFSQMHTGEPISPKLESIHKIDINGLVKEDTLTFSFTYNTCEYRKETLQQLAHGFKTNLIKIIEHCTGREEKELTPSDLGDEELSLEELEDIKDMISL